MSDDSAALVTAAAVALSIGLGRVPVNRRPVRHVKARPNAANRAALAKKRAKRKTGKKARKANR